MPPEFRVTSMRMRLQHALILTAVAVGLYAGRAAAAKDPAAPYLGMTMAEIIACAGEPHSRFESGPGKETLTFRYTGAGPVPADKSSDKKSDAKKGDKKSGDKKSADKAKTPDAKQADTAGDKPADEAKAGNKSSDDAKGDDKAAAAGTGSGKSDEKKADKNSDDKSDDKKSDDKKSGKNKLASIFGKNKKKDDKDWTCSASLVFEGGKLVRVNFSHRDVRSPYQWQSEKDEKKAEAMRQEGVPTCEFSLPRCLR
jgi:hypothetical protein